MEGLLSMGPTPSSYWKRMENFSQKGSPTSIYLEQPILLRILTLLQSLFVCVYVFVTLVYFLAALRSCRSVVVRRSVCPSVRPSVRLSVRRSVYLSEKVIFRVLNGNLNLPTYLPMRQ